MLRALLIAGMLSCLPGATAVAQDQPSRAAPAAPDFTPAQQERWQAIHTSCRNYVADLVEAAEQDGRLNQRLSGLDPEAFKNMVRQSIETEMLVCLNDEVGKDPLFGASYRIQVSVEEVKPPS